MEMVRNTATSDVQQRVYIKSIFDFGITAKEMLVTWKELKKSNKKIILQEFPDVDLYQIISNVDGLDILEFTLQVFNDIEIKKREKAKAKQAEGIAKARQMGITLGRRPLSIPNNFEHIYKQVLEKQITISSATKMLGVDYKTYKKWANAWLNK